MIPRPLLAMFMVRCPGAAAARCSSTGSSNLSPLWSSSGTMQQYSCNLSPLTGQDNESPGYNSTEHKKRKVTY